MEEEIKVLSQGMSEEDAKKSRKNFEEIAKKRIKVGLILNEFGEQNQIKVNEQELQSEIQKQIRMMPGQEKMVMDFYQKNPSAVASLRGTVYEDKIINLIKEKAKSNKKEITKDEAEKILKQSQKQQLDQELKEQRKPEKKVESKKSTTNKTKPKPLKAKPTAKKTKKVSKK
jgi:trigger factor